MDDKPVRNKLVTYFANQRIVVKFSSLLVLLLVGGATGSGIFLWRALQIQAQNEIAKQGMILTEAMNSVRAYTSNNILPLLQEDMLSSEEFISETVPAFSAREVFERFRSDEDYKSFYYTEATANPMNPRNLADPFEEGLLSQMKADPFLEQITGYRIIYGEEVYYIAQPMRVTTESCLNCHSTPEEAPANLINTYGPDDGFGWEMGQIIAAQIIYVPAADVKALAARSFWSIIAIFVVVIALVLLTINILLRRFVISPIGIMGDLAHKVRLDEDISGNLEAKDLNEISARKDELGDLASVLQRMVREVYERTKMLKDQLMSLTIEINEMKKAEEVDQVTSSEFFKDLQSKAKDYKSNRKTGGE
ncbi:MAG: DUF3365 domain-containing protein [Anaerolineae bacterium]|nr:DUF3365 domain-containing protein [Anaerolineae bacterium]